MRPPKLIVCLAAAAAFCAFAISNAHAVVSPVFAATNDITFSATATTNGAVTTVNVTNTSYAAPKTAAHKTADLIKELGSATTNSFSTSAKLVMITGFGGTNLFAVIDGAKFVNVSSFIHIDSSDTRINSGLQNKDGLADPTLKSEQIITFSFDASGLSFNLTGIGTSTTTDTVPSASTGVYTETYNAKMTGSGQGTAQGVPFIASGTVSISGKGELHFVP